MDKKAHWEQIYDTKQLNEVSWYQPVPTESLNWIQYFNVPATAKIIDVGGGDSLFVDHLLDMGYQDITVLDISEAALQRAKDRLGERAVQVKWVASDVTSFKPSVEYDFWHDRAAFHFLTADAEIDSYINTVNNGLTKQGILVIGTFSEQGPRKCSGIEIKQYSEISMTESLQENFTKIKCVTVDHKTPFDTIQNFIFCSFRQQASA